LLEKISKLIVVDSDLLRTTISSRCLQVSKHTINYRVGTLSNSVVYYRKLTELLSSGIDLMELLTTKLRKARAIFSMQETAKLKKNSQSFFSVG